MINEQLNSFQSLYDLLMLPLLTIFILIIYNSFGKHFQNGMRRNLEPHSLEHHTMQSDNVQELKRAIADVQRTNKMLAADIQGMTRGNDIKRNHNKSLKEKMKGIQQEMEKIINDHMKVFEEKIEAQKGNNTGGSQYGINPFALSRLPSYKFEPSHDQTICLVCYADLDRNARVKMLPDCRHVYHSQCIKQHLMVSKYCPGCGMQVRL